MKRHSIDWYVAVMLCLLAGLYIFIGYQWFGRATVGHKGGMSEIPVSSDEPFAHAHLRDRIQRIRMDGLPLSKALDQLQDHTHARIAVRWEQLEVDHVDAKTPVYLNLTDIDLGTALHVMLKNTAIGLDYGVLSDGTIVVTRGVDAPESLVVYDIRGLIPPAAPPQLIPASPPGVPAATFGGGIGAMGGWEDHLSPEEALGNLIDACLANDPHEQSDSAVPQPVQFWADRLFVTGTPQTHRKIESILRELKANDIKRKAEFRSKP